jgi:gas vesicle protein
MTYDMRRDNGRTRSYSRLLAGLAAAAVGGVLALLFAPRRGTDMRQELASGAQRAGRRLNDAYGTVADSVRQSARRPASEAQHLRDRAEDAAEDVAEDAADSLRHAVDDASARLQSTGMGPGRPGTSSSHSPIG